MSDMGAFLILVYAALNIFQHNVSHINISSQEWFPQVMTSCPVLLIHHYDWQSLNPPGFLCPQYPVTGIV